MVRTREEILADAALHPPPAGALYCIYLYPFLLHRAGDAGGLCTEAGAKVSWWALESLSGFPGAQRTGRLRVSPAWQIEVEVSVRAPCGAGWNQAF